MTVTNLPELSLDELVTTGYLQEVNRRFFHPLGLALFVRTNAAGEPIELGIFDGRDDPEGIFFSDGYDAVKAAKVQGHWDGRRPFRVRALGFMVQGEAER